MGLLGIDVSKWQGAGLDWPAISAGGFDFAFAKATEGTAYVDPDFAVNAAHMASSSILPGAYAWLTPGADQAVAAKLFVSTVGSRLAAGWRAAIDVEQSGVTVADLRSWATAFGALTSGHPLFIYIGRNIIRDLGSPNLADLGPWWEPYYPGGVGYPGDASPVWTSGLAGWPGPTIWQYGSARIPSYTGAVDGDASRLTRAELAALGGNMQPLYITSVDPKMVGLTTGDQLFNPDGSPLVKMSMAATRPSPYEVAIGATKYRVITVVTGGHAVVALVRDADVSISTPATPADASPFTQADLDAARTSGYASAKAAATKAVGGI